MWTAIYLSKSPTIRDRVQVFGQIKPVSCLLLRIYFEFVSALCSPPPPASAKQKHQKVVHFAVCGQHVTTTTESEEKVSFRVDKDKEDRVVLK